MEAQNKILKRIIDQQQEALGKADENAMLRMNINTSLSANGVDKANTDALIQAGEDMYNKGLDHDKEQIEALIRSICDERFKWTLFE